MTSYIAYFLRFLYRIKWWILLLPPIVAYVVYVYMGGMARSYKSSTTIYTGVVSGYDLESGSGSGSRQDWNVINNAMDNLMNIIQSQTTLHKVALRLYALNMIKGDPEKDNNYILAKNYRRERDHTPPEVLALIDPQSEENTLANLLKFERADHSNHVYGLFQWEHPYYSYQALKNIQVKRIANSDMLEISYENNDPGIVFNTLEILNKEFVEQYKDLRFGEANNVIEFFQAELNRVGKELRIQEDSLRDYNIENLIINYDEQTKHVTILSRDFELQAEAIKLNLQSSETLRNTIEDQLDGLKTFRDNADFVRKLHTIGDLQSRITATEAFSPTDALAANRADIPQLMPTDLSILRSRLVQETDSLRSLSSKISSQRFTKEGISTNSLVSQWLDAVLLSEKSKAEMTVITDWETSINKRYQQFAPVGSTLKRKNRLINFTEQSYLSILQALNTARLRQKNLQMSSATLKIINPPVLPISAEPTKRKMMVMAAFFGTLFFILGFFILLELLDRTLRDKLRTERITGGKVMGALPSSGSLLARRYTQQYRQIATRTLSNAMLNYIAPEQGPNIVNIVSTERGDGKSELIDSLASHLREKGLKVRVVSWNKDFDAEQRNYLLANQLSDFAQDTKGELPLSEADLILVEHPPMSEYSTPKNLLRHAVLNIVIIPANRTWKENNQVLYDKCVTLSGTVPTTICLNYASRDVLESFTGLLPPYTRMRKLGYQLAQFGFTAVK